MNNRDTISLAYRTIRGNKLRTGITVAIIALGIAALIGINTAIQAISQKFMESFSSMGANGFTIRYRAAFRFDRGEMKKEKKGRRLKKSSTNKPITKEEAEAFKERYDYPAKVALSLGGGNGNTAAYGNKKTNPTVWVNGGDENYVDLNGYTISNGRNLSEMDVSTGRNVVLLGKDVADKLFNGKPENAVDKIIRINNIPFRVIGTLSPKGSTFGRSLDNIAITSYNSVRRFFAASSSSSFSIGVKSPDIINMETAIGEAEGTFRNIRKVILSEEDNFLIDKSDTFVELALKQIGWLTASAVVIGIITLVGAAIGLMNIMLVAVTERTKEVGLVKAIGGKQRDVRWQFLYESILISLLGALFGIVLGVLLGNVVSLLMSTGFVIPWFWVFLGVVICTFVGLAAGSYPAYKASKLNPIEALRYE
ncbi:ABC transporter permease [Flavihumibacter rivuli]|uniref:ABC transporter permease n=1 Tax=Flavihumibacter rivuli TaxID=2838156 RepID=UPI001BDF41FC|nr:ABC transporter permease [Flavihumibacter rivuli]ULQ58339.1 ABC transporter permease [Flavihumibacter rivuli]